MFTYYKYTRYKDEIKMYACTIYNHAKLIIDVVQCLSYKQVR